MPVDDQNPPSLTDLRYHLNMFLDEMFKHVAEINEKIGDIHSSVEDLDERIRSLENKIW
jgi:chromosome segregation ATPase